MLPERRPNSCLQSLCSVDPFLLFLFKHLTLQPRGPSAIPTHVPGCATSAHTDASLAAAQAQSFSYGVRGLHHWPLWDSRAGACAGGPPVCSGPPLPFLLLPVFPRLWGEPAGGSSIGPPEDGGRGVRTFLLLSGSISGGSCVSSLALAPARQACCGFSFPTWKERQGVPRIFAELLMLLFLKQ